MRFKTISICLLALFLGKICSAQFATIPDPNFAVWLQTNHPACMSGNQLDTTCPGILGDTAVFLNNLGIADLEGIQYFASLRQLFASNNQLSSLPQLSDSLNWLILNDNSFTQLPPLPSGVENLNVDRNQIVYLVSLPPNLDILRAEDNLMLQLPPLPQSLRYLDVERNSLTSLPTLPPGLLRIQARENQLTALPPLPSSLENIGIQFNQISGLPDLPDSLEVLYAVANQLYSLPMLPNKLKFLSIGFNNLTALPLLPDSLELLAVGSNQITFLPPLPKQLQQLVVDSNQLACLPLLPDSLLFLNLEANPFTCLPNYVVAMSQDLLNMPLCINNDPVNNPSGCAPAQGITGAVYQDLNADCSPNSPDRPVYAIPLKLYDSLGSLVETRTSLGNGAYFFSTDSATYRVAIDTIGKPYTFNCPQPGLDSTVTLTTAEPLAADLDFEIDCKPGSDLGVAAIVPTGTVLPGQTHLLTIRAGDLFQRFGLDCGNSPGGELRLDFSGPITWTGVPSYAIPAGSIGNNELLYFFSGNVDIDSSFVLEFTTDTNAQSGDSICMKAWVSYSSSLNDLDSSNDTLTYCYEVTNSYDPNAKTVYPKRVLPGYADWLTYTIYFQNTGSAPAFNIQLLDTLEANLNLESLEILASSHPCQVSLQENHLSAFFSNIQLPDSFSDPEGSQGFIQFRIRPVPGLPIGTTINNRAGIYFDYNSPIVTTFAVTTFGTQVGATEAIGKASPIQVFPNPSTGLFHLEIQGTQSHKPIEIEIFNALGDRVKAQRFLSGKSLEIDLTGYTSGVYLIKGTSNGSWYKKVIVQE